MPRVRPNCACRVFSTKLRIVVHDFMRQLLEQLLADRTILTASQFRDGLCDCVDHFIGFVGIDFV